MPMKVTRAASKTLMGVPEKRGEGEELRRSDANPCPQVRHPASPGLFRSAVFRLSQSALQASARRLGRSCPCPPNPKRLGALLSHLDLNPWVLTAEIADPAPFMELRK